MNVDTFWFRGRSLISLLGVNKHKKKSLTNDSRTAHKVGSSKHVLELKLKEPV